jgi:hypothetical protein
VSFFKYPYLALSNVPQKDKITFGSHADSLVRILEATVFRIQSDTPVALFSLTNTMQYYDKVANISDVKRINEYLQCVPHFRGKSRFAFSLLVHVKISKFSEYAFSPM